MCVCNIIVEQTKPPTVEQTKPPPPLFRSTVEQTELCDGMNKYNNISLTYRFIPYNQIINY